MTKRDELIQSLNAQFVDMIITGINWDFIDMLFEFGFKGGVYNEDYHNIRWEVNGRCYKIVRDLEWEKDNEVL